MEIFEVAFWLIVLGLVLKRLFAGEGESGKAIRAASEIHL